jgi:hypothetical protein
MMTARIHFKTGGHKLCNLKRFELERNDPEDKYATLFLEDGDIVDFKLKELAEVVILEAELEKPVENINHGVSRRKHGGTRRGAGK